jgi:uncharacterized protein with FMN-binding domain
MRRVIPALALTAAGFFFVWQYEPGALTAAIAAPPPTVISSQTTSPSTGTSTTTTVVGSPETNRYGVVQVQVVFTDGKITDVQFLQLPDSGPSQVAAPILRQETLTAQSAHVDTVSGATMTSDSYVTSLQAAIDAKGA